METVKVLVTRPRLFAEPLCEKINAWGALPILFPTIEICPVSISQCLDEQLKNLPNFDMAIFTSRPAAIYGMSAILKQWPLLPNRLPNILFAAIGKGTAEELKQRGVLTVLHPEHPPFETESLLAISQLQNIQAKKILLFRGNEGRQLLFDTLQARGACVTIAQVYRRTLPKPISIETLPNIVIVTSPQCLTNLKMLVRPTLWERLQHCFFIIVGWRTYHLSATLGIRKRYLAEGAEDSQLLQTLTQVFNDIKKGTQ